MFCIVAYVAAYMSVLLCVRQFGLCSRPYYSSVQGYCMHCNYMYVLQDCVGAL